MHLNGAPDQNRHRIWKVGGGAAAVCGLTRDANEAAESVNQSALSVRPRPSVPAAAKTQSETGLSYTKQTMRC